jgi:membrane protein implicated in regulation of membrane protease activity
LENKKKARDNPASSLFRSVELKLLSFLAFVGLLAILASAFFLAVLALLALCALTAASLGGIGHGLDSLSLTLCSLLGAVVVATRAEAQSSNSKRNDNLLHDALY